MIVDIKMPVLGETTQEAEILEWFKDIGDFVKRGEAMLEVQTDKITVEVPALEPGVIKEIIASVGESIAIGELIAKLETDRKAKIGTKKEIITKPNNIEKLRASPAARRLARAQSINLQDLKTGTGPRGRITKADVNKYLAQKTNTSKSASPANSYQLGPIEKVTAQRTQQSFQEAPHFYLRHKAEITAVTNYLNTLDKPNRPSINDVLVLAVAKTLENHSRLNSSFKDNQVNILEDINIGVITATEAGLMTSVVKNADRLKAIEIKKQISQIRQRIKNKTASSADIEGASFSISNLGMFGIDEFSAIILPPNVAILAVGRVKEEILVNNGQMHIGKTITLTVSADHRATDGVMVALFLKELEQRLSNLEGWLY